MFRSESLRIRRITKISNGVNKRDKKRLQTTSVSMQKEEVKKAPVVLMEDNLVKEKRTLVVIKQSHRYVNSFKTKRNADKKEQGAPYNIPEVQQGLEARTSLVCSHLLSCTGI